MPSEGLYIDHVILGVMDIDAAIARLRRDHGLGAVPGGVHRGGTTNALIPLTPPTFSSSSVSGTRRCRTAPGSPGRWTAPTG